MTHTDTIEHLKTTAPRPLRGFLTVPPDTLVVAEGTEAWKRIKQRARMDREDWKLVGEALLIGRRDNKSNQAFGRWCRENGFGDMRPATRADALWLVERWDEVWSVLHGVQDGNAHPTHVRQAHREATKGGGKATQPFTQADAEYAQKLHAMSTRGAEHEAAVAQAKLDTFAKQFGMTGEQVVEKAEKVNPTPEPVSPMDKAITQVQVALNKKSKKWLVVMLMKALPANPDLMN